MTSRFRLEIGRFPSVGHLVRLCEERGDGASDCLYGRRTKVDIGRSEPSIVVASRRSTDDDDGGGRRKEEGTHLLPLTSWRKKGKGESAPSDAASAVASPFSSPSPAPAVASRAGGADRFGAATTTRAEKKPVKSPRRRRSGVVNVGLSLREIEQGVNETSGHSTGWKSSSLELWLNGGGGGGDRETSGTSGLVYRNSVRIMVRPDGGGGGVASAQRSSSEERNGGEASSSSSSVPPIKRKESLGVMQRAVVKEQFR